jgi:AraC family transcriptional regulator
LAASVGAVTTLAETHGLVTRLGTRIWASSEGLGWRSVFATTQREAPFEGAFRAVADHLVVVHLSGPVRVSRTLAGKVESALVPPGGAFIMPGGAEFGVRLEAPLDTVHFYLRRAIVEECAAEQAAGAVEIVPRLGRPDPLLEQIAIELRNELQEASDPAALYVDQLARTAAGRLVRAHSTAAKRLRPVTAAGLAPTQLRRAVDYLAANLHGDPSLTEVAAAVGLCAVHFARQFRQATGLAPHQYLLKARIERARQLLAGDLPIAAIAADCGFCHQEHLTRVFRKHCGTTPGVYRRTLRA